jgi:hypothetical protein
MIFDARTFLKAYNVRTQEHGENWQKGWLQINCPFCSDTMFHGGFKLLTGGYNCWRCKYHKTREIVSKLVRIPESNVTPIIKNFLILSPFEPDETRETKRPSELKLPAFTDELETMHLKYLTDRNFNPKRLQKEWGLLGTGIHGPYKFRIIAPIYFNNILVSYQGRDITDKARQRYKGCALEREVIPHKNLLYGIDKVGNTAIIVEGITDVWRIGPGAVATFGTTYTPSQINVLANMVDHVVIMYDADAEEEQEKLAADLSAVGLTVEELTLESGDPGDLQPNDIRALRKEFF